MKNENGICSEALSEVLGQIADEDGKYYGGVVAYLNAAISLALLSKLYGRLSRKENEYSSFYKEEKVVVDLTLKITLYLADHDGDIFEALRKEPSKEKDEIINKVLDEQNNFVMSINRINEGIDKSVLTIKGSIKEDFIMVEKTLETSKENILSIIAFEKRKLQN